MDEESNRNRPSPVPSWTYYEPIMDPLWINC